MEYDTKQAWRRLVGRCLRPGYDGYNGAQLCDRWRDYDAFVEDMGVRPSKWHKLHRRDTALPWTTDNVEWCEDGIIFEGNRRTIREWARRLGYGETALYARLEKRWPIEKAFMQPVRGSRPGVHSSSLWALRVDGMADGVRFDNQISNPYETMNEALEVYRGLVVRSREPGNDCRLELLRRAPSDHGWTIVLSHSR